MQLCVEITLQNVTLTLTCKPGNAGLMRAMIESGTSVQGITGITDHPQIARDSN